MKYKLFTFVLYELNVEYPQYSHFSKCQDGGQIWLLIAVIFVQDAVNTIFLL